MEHQDYSNKCKDAYEECCKQLDDLTIQQIDLLEEQLILASKLESVMKTGFIEMAKSRYIKGEKYVSILQLPGDESCIQPLACVKHNSQNRLLLERDEQGKNPLSWFGVLVPNSLRESQKAFQAALDIVVHLVNARIQWLDTLNNAQNVKESKQKIPEVQEPQLS